MTSEIVILIVTIIAIDIFYTFATLNPNSVILRQANDKRNIFILLISVKRVVAYSSFNQIKDPFFYRVQKNFFR